MKRQKTTPVATPSNRKKTEKEQKQIRSNGIRFIGNARFLAFILPGDVRFPVILRLISKLFCFSIISTKYRKIKIISPNKNIASKKKKKDMDGIRSEIGLK